MISHVAHLCTHLGHFYELAKPFGTNGVGAVQGTVLSEDEVDVLADPFDVVAMLTSEDNTRAGGGGGGRGNEFMSS